MIPPGKKHSVRLGATFVRTVNVPGRYGDGYGGLGLSLMVTPRESGGLSKTWAQAASPNGRKTSLGLGSWPMVTLAVAREKALANARAIALGRDPRPRLQRHAPRLGGFINPGVPRSPRGHKNPHGSRVAVCSLSLHRIRCGSSCLRRGVCPQDIAVTAIRHWIAPFGTNVDFSRPRCQWQHCGWRHHATPSRKPHELTDEISRILRISNEFPCLSVLADPTSRHQ